MNPDIKDIKPPIAIPGHFEWIWITAIVVAVLGVITVAVLYWLKRPKAEKPVETGPTYSAWERAYAKLENLKYKKLIERADLKPFYIELSHIVRHYLEERFNIRAPEMTTEEFLDSLKFSPVLNEAQKKILRDFLSTCDLVKFAKHQPTVAEAQHSFDLVKALIGQTHGI